MRGKKNGHSPGENSKDSPLQMPLDAKTPPLADVTLICHHCHKAIDMTEIAEMIRMSERQRILDILKKNECKIGTYHHMRIVKEIEQGDKDNG